MVTQGSIDQTRLAIADEGSGVNAPFCFTVMGDTDAGGVSQPNSFSAGFAQQLMQQIGESRFLLHTGDVTYPIGTYQNYLSGFLRPYRALIAVLPDKAQRSVVFRRPLLLVPGNHDYGRQPFWVGAPQRALRFLCDRLRQFVGIDLGHYGGQGGEAYGKTFLDDLSRFSPKQLKQHLLDHYSARLDTADSDASNPRGLDPLTSAPIYCLNYEPGHFTRLPNRYYRFRYGSVDFFALDSNTWKGDPANPGFDQAQLDWLVQGLIDSWRGSLGEAVSTPRSSGRILYLHHSPYTTENTRWQQSETRWVRHHLRQALDRVKETLTAELGDPFLESLNTLPLVNLIISGHAHCLEHIKTAQTGHADSNLDWLVCGGSGLSIRRQRQAGANILGSLAVAGRRTTEVIARSQLYAGVHGHKGKNQHFHSFVKIDVKPGVHCELTIRPFVVVKSRSGWQTRALDKISIGLTAQATDSPPQRSLQNQLSTIS